MEGLALFTNQELLDELLDRFESAFFIGKQEDLNGDADLPSEQSRFPVIQAGKGEARDMIFLLKISEREIMDEFMKSESGPEPWEM